ncbi:MAG: hypothetical protein Q8859_08900 [Bacteroidota bacterium]|nr:hypothetical protein [Bacteroidota bacterium]
MDKKDDIYNKIREALSQIPEKFCVLEDQINIELQMQYFRYSKRLKNNVDTDKIMNNKELLFTEEISPKEKKILLAKLAGIDSVEAFRTIERYCNQADSELKEWAILALQESRMILQNSLLGEDQVFISTGLGGRGNKLRYFIVLPKKELTEFTPVQEKVIRNEIDFTFPKHETELENLKFFKGFATFTALVPIQCDFQVIFNNLLQDCNEFGNFIDEDIIITNVRYLSEEEIRVFLEQKSSNEEKN